MRSKSTPHSSRAITRTGSIAVRQQHANGDIEQASEQWPVILEETPLQADTVHRFESELVQTGPVSHVRINVFPDGGISRIRIFGRVAGACG